jgi:hypothetical protein
VRIRVGASHRTLSTYLNALIDAGFSLERVVEPPAPVPTFLLSQVESPLRDDRVTEG